MGASDEVDEESRELAAGESGETEPQAVTNTISMKTKMKCFMFFSFFYGRHPPFNGSHYDFSQLI
jgi:hypothetical protein